MDYPPPIGGAPEITSTLMIISTNSIRISGFLEICDSFLLEAEQHFPLISTDIKGEEYFNYRCQEGQTNSIKKLRKRGFFQIVLFPVMIVLQMPTDSSKILTEASTNDSKSKV